MPLDVNAMVMVVNTDLLERFGHTLDDLRTWDGLGEVAAVGGRARRPADPPARLDVEHERLAAGQRRSVVRS